MRNFNLKIWQDNCFSDDWTSQLEDTGIRFVTKCKDYDIGTEKIKCDVVEHIMHYSLEFTSDRQVDYVEKKFGTLYSNETLEYVLGRLFNKTYGKKVYMYEHSGASIRTSPFSCSWDSGMVGYIYVYDTELFRKSYGLGRNWKKKADEIIEKYVRYINILLQGDVHGFTITDVNGDIIDSMGGIVGDLREKDTVDHIIESVVSATPSLDDFTDEELVDWVEDAIDNIKY